MIVGVYTSVHVHRNTHTHIHAYVWLLHMHACRVQSHKGQWKQHPQESGTPLRFILRLKSQSASAHRFKGETEDGKPCKTQHSALGGLTTHHMKTCTWIAAYPSLCFPCISQWLGQRAAHRSHLHFATDQTGRTTEICASDHAATVARQHDYVHPLLLGNQHSHPIHTQPSALNCYLIAFKGKG